jgi:hypothetical protein
MGIVDPNIDYKQEFQQRERELWSLINLDYEQLYRLFDWPNAYIKES